LNNGPGHAKAYPVDWIVPEGPKIISGQGPIGRGLCLVCGAKRRNGPISKADESFGGASVIEIVAPFFGDTWRAVYTVRFQDVVYVLHAFQKKSKSGIATPMKELDLVRQRLATAEKDYKQRPQSK
jgi:phage-related protein